MIVGAPGYTAPDRRGRAYRVLRFRQRLELRARTGLQRATSPPPTSAISVSAAGDVNGDGYGDIIVGAYGDERYQTADGTAYAYYGSPSGLSPTPNWIVGGRRDSPLRIRGQTAGDVNGDGYSDVLVGENNYLYAIERQGERISTTVGVRPEHCTGMDGLGQTWAAVLRLLPSERPATSTATATATSWSAPTATTAGWAGPREPSTFTTGPPQGYMPSADWMAVGDQADSYFGVSAKRPGT